MSNDRAADYQQQAHIVRHTLPDGTAIQMTCIGQWIDLARYWEGSDGNAWATGNSRNSWVNKGPIAEFRRHFAARYRGELYEVQQ